MASMKRKGPYLADEAHTNNGRLHTGNLDKENIYVARAAMCSLCFSKLHWKGRHEYIGAYIDCSCCANTLRQAVPFTEFLEKNKWN